MLFSLAGTLVVGYSLEERHGVKVVFWAYTSSALFASIASHLFVPQQVLYSLAYVEFAPIIQSFCFFVFLFFFLCVFFFLIEVCFIVGIFRPI